ncbi:hypothetical protein F5144DRAFT_207538 [Chaetomium tenue]|uniref:Uncharacterized protein n=1 Tax=Chaetomium tenue TaxID=1854479 RepID=A0ACB7PD84_9PEZI|nr:hypothetical protein F5144DRAFT_207538 [Chaetomium globosum]
MEKRKEILGEEHPGILAGMGRLGFTYRKQGRWKEAEKLVKMVYELRSKVLGEIHDSTLTSMGQLAIIWWNQGRLDEALELMRRRVKFYQQTLSPDHPRTSKKYHSSLLRRWEGWKEE